MLVNYKNIGDTLTTAELNAYASLLAHNKALNDSFKLKNGVINGIYGNYEFDLSNASIVDNGILITDETLASNITVKLENPTQYATYTLNLKVLRYGETSLLDEEPQSEIIPLTVELVEDTAINIPLTDLQEYDIILFDTNITVKHDKPEIIGKYITALDLTANNPIIQTQETSTLEITATDLEHLPMPNKSIQLLKNNTLLDTLTTDSQGKCSYVYTGVGDGLLNFIAKYRGLQSETYIIIDCEWYDTGVTGTTSLYFLQNSNVTRSIGDDGTTISNSHATSSSYACAVLTSVSTLADTKQFTGNNMIEVDIISYTGGALQINGDSNASISLATYGSAPFTMQMKVVDGVAYYYTGSEWTALATVGGDAYAIRFAIIAGTTIKYKNWKIYPI